VRLQGITGCHLCTHNDLDSQRFEYSVFKQLLGLSTKLKDLICAGADDADLLHWADLVCTLILYPPISLLMECQFSISCKKEPTVQDPTIQKAWRAPFWTGLPPRDKVWLRLCHGTSRTTVGLSMRPQVPFYAQQDCAGRTPSMCRVLAL